MTGVVIFVTLFTTVNLPLLDTGAQMAKDLATVIIRVTFVAWSVGICMHPIHQVGRVVVALLKGVRAVLVLINVPVFELGTGIDT